MPISDNLIRYWKCDDGFGTILVDSISTINATIQNPTGSDFVASKAAAFNTAFQCVNNGDYFLDTFALSDASALPLGGTARTMLLTFYYSGSGSSELMGYGQDLGVPGSVFGLAITDNGPGDIKMYFGGYVADLRFETLASLSVGWHFVAITHDGSNNITCYLDGNYETKNTVVETTFAINTLLTEHSNFNIGRIAGPGWTWIGNFSGPEDDVAVWSRALSTAELDSIYSAWVSDQPLQSLLLVPPIITTAALTNGAKNAFYGPQYIEASGSDPKTWSIVSSDLSSGISLTQIGNVFKVDGFPTQIKKNTVRVKALNGAGENEKEFEFYIGRRKDDLSQADGLNLLWDNVL